MGAAFNDGSNRKERNHRMHPYPTSSKYMSHKKQYLVTEPDDFDE
jgi:hypothetical protein